MIFFNVIQFKRGRFTQWFCGNNVGGVTSLATSFSLPKSTRKNPCSSFLLSFYFLSFSDCLMNNTTKTVVIRLHVRQNFDELKNFYTLPSVKIFNISKTLMLNATMYISLVIIASTKILNILQSCLELVNLNIKNIRACTERDVPQIIWMTATLLKFGIYM